MRGIFLDAARIDQGLLVLEPQTVEAGSRRSIHAGVGHSFFETMQIDILAGRSIADFEVDAGEAVAVVARNFAEAFFPGGDAVGRTIDVQDEGQLRIVGVENARHDVARGDARPVVYYTYMWDPHALFGMVLELRTQGDPLAHAGALRTIVRELHSEVRLNAIRTQAANTDRTISREILFARLSNAFAVLALVIACAGLCGTVSHAMVRQTPETGIRMALGATRGLVVRRALRQALGLGLAGLAIGVPAALLAARYIESSLWGVAPHDPLIVGGAALAVPAAVTAAGYAPGRLVYNAAMDAPRTAQRDSEHDETLIEWFLSLTPAERLAELESRLAFFNQARRDGDRKLPANSRDS